VLKLNFGKNYLIIFAAIFIKLLGGFSDIVVELFCFILFLTALTIPLYVKKLVFMLYVFTVSPWQQ